MNLEDLLAEQYADASNLEVRGEFNSQFSTRSDHPHDWIFERLDLPADADLLEVGCGPGTFWERNADRVPDDWSLLLSDFSRGMIDDARRTLDGNVETNYAVLEASRIPVTDGSLDAVLANQMLYHVPDRIAALREFRRVLRPGGRLYVSTVSAHNKATLYDMLDEVADGTVEPLPAGGFTVENGADQIREAFDAVDVHRYENTLSVTDADLLVAYALSLPDAKPLEAFDPEDASTLRSLAERRLDGGPIEMQSDLGLFVARA